jgi:hypothetical protein
MIGERDENATAVFCIMFNRLCGPLATDSDAIAAEALHDAGGLCADRATILRLQVGWLLALRVVAGLAGCGTKDVLAMITQNTWPGGYRHVMHQSEHERWNASNYPGTRQLCVLCESTTERCEEDKITVESIDGPLCEECYHKTPEWIAKNAA